MRKYSEYLVATNNSMNKLHHSDKSSARGPENSSTMYRIAACENNNLSENYIRLNDVLFEKHYYEYINIQSYLPNDVMKRYRFIKNLQLTFPIGIYRYHQENYLGTISYIWKIPEIEVFNDEQNETSKARNNNNYNAIQLKISPAILRMLYFDLTGDASVTSNAISREVEERLRLMLTLADPDIIFDLRTNNGFKGTKFNEFWDELEAYFNEQNLLAVDERRHGTVLYIYPLLYLCVLAAADHDFTKLSLTPSVIFFISIPNDISESFYNGQVFVSYKDTVFEPSSAIRHSAEFLNALNVQYEHQILPPILCLYTDGGPDHQCNYGSVQIALICLFLCGDFDLLIAVRTAPNHSWTNPAERVMSTLNIGLQGVALKRDQMSPGSEALFEMANTLDDIRKKAQESNELTSELKESITNIQNLLNNRTERLLFKDKKFRCHEPANEERIAALFESISDIDSTLRIEETTQAQIRRHPTLVEFINTHCRARAYSFQIKKCNNPTCLYCKPIRLPLSEFNTLSFLPDPIPSQDNTDHYATFQDVYGTETTEKYRPTYMKSQASAEPIPKSILVVSKIRGYINCEDCGKRRCVYSEKSLTHEEQEDFQQVLDSYSYSCGAPVFPDDHYLKELIFVCTQISCDSPIEILYYSSRKSGNYPICYYCGEREDLVTPPQSLRECFKQIYPLCEECHQNRKEFYTKGEVKTNGQSSKRQKR
ncbi:unnamed protein product [Rhizophagus irregularis]|nr:unnamed protein product [Rhizophagus irregularis]